MGGDFHDIRFDRPEPAIARIILARPKQMNAYTTRLCEEVVRALEDYLRNIPTRLITKPDASFVGLKMFADHNLD